MRDGLLRRAVLVMIAAALLSGATIGIYLFWYHNRGTPAPARRTITAGVVYERFVVDGPAVVHLLTIDLSRGVTWLGTPPDPSGGRQTIARLTSTFLDETAATIAINTAYFAPWHSNTLLDYYPHVGDPVDCIGATITDGSTLAPYDPNLSSLWVLADGTVVIDGDNHKDARFAYSGFPLLDDGASSPPSKGTAHGTRHPRTAAALDRDGSTLLLVVVDGRQPSYSEGLAVEPLAEILRERGGWDAVLFDGGGSATMVVAGEGVINTPVHGRHPPGVERPVACHLGLQIAPR